VVAVAHDVSRADPVDRDRRHRRSVRLRHPQPLPVLARAAIRAELGVERLRLDLLDGRVDRVDRDRHDAERPARREPRPARAVVDDLEALGREPAQPPPQARPAARAHEPLEAGLGLGPGHPGHRDHRVDEHQQRADAQQPAGRAADRDGGERQHARRRECPTRPW